MRVSGVATEDIPYGALVLCRSFRVSLADQSVANGVAKDRPSWCGRDRIYRKGEMVVVTPVQGLGGRDLHAIAAGPIMRPDQLYLPAGKISLADAKAREAALLTAEDTDQ